MNPSILLQIHLSKVVSTHPLRQSILHHNSILFYQLLSNLFVQLFLFFHLLFKVAVSSAIFTSNGIPSSSSSSMPTYRPGVKTYECFCIFLRWQICRSLLRFGNLRLCASCDRCRVFLQCLIR